MSALPSDRAVVNGAASVSAVPASVPSAREIEEHLVRNPEDADYVVQMPARTRADPEELWLAGLGVWIRTDGSVASGDCGRGLRYFDGDERVNLRRAVAYWKTSLHAQAIEARRAETQGGSVHESAVAEPCAQPSAPDSGAIS